MQAIVNTPRSLTLALCIGTAACLPAAGNDASSWQLWYDQPAAKWIEALPVGNGRLGAMCFGGVGEARIQLNEEAVWAGPPVPEDNPAMRQALAAAREAWFVGDYGKAESLVARAMGPRISPRSYQTLGDLRLTLDGLEGKVSNYRRELDLDTAIATTTFTVAGVDYQREVFASPVHDMLVIRIEASEPGKLNMQARLDRPADFAIAASRPEGLAITMTGQAQHKGKHLGTRWQATLSGRSDGGDRELVDNTLNFSNAQVVTLFLAAATDYNRESPQDRLVDFSQRIARGLQSVEHKAIDELRQDHIAAHRKLFRRVTINLGDSPAASNLPTDQRLERVKKGDLDPALAALYFQYGRYLLVSCSRPGCMPSNLQGLWNEHIEAPWNSDYHLNINTQMHYWPAEVTGLGECHLPLLDYTERLVPAGRQTARRMFGARGATAGHTSDAWLWTAIIGNPGYGMWPHGLGWNSLHFAEHYRYTGDEQFLRQRAYPLLKEASLFYLDYLTPHPETGQLIAGPDTSPENRYAGPDGKPHHVSMGPSMSQQLVWETFTNTLEAAEILGIQDSFVDEVRTARGKLYAPQIGSDGRLMEWMKEFDEPDPGHRHISHLFAVHPGRQYNRIESSEMLTAARKTIDYRLANGGGHTGWSRAWIINFFARFGEGNLAEENIRALLAKSTHPNLFDNHPPFQIDGNFGGTAGIAEMLLQSHVQHDRPRGPYEIELLPALPDAWPTGSVAGLRARGGFVVDIEWQDGKLATATLRSTGGRHCWLKYGDHRVEVWMEPGKVIAFNGRLDHPQLNPHRHRRSRRLAPRNPEPRPDGGEGS